MSRSSVALSSIPTVAQLYKSGQWRAAAAASASAHAVADRVSLYRGDITALEVDAIVNAANETLLGGGGVDGAIHRAAGPELKQECRTLKGCRTGDAKITRGYELPARHVIHTVGPVYAKGRADESRQRLQSAYRRSLEEASKASLSSVAFPSIGTGVYGYPIEEATQVAIDTVGEYLTSKEGEKLDRVVFCVFSEKDYTIYETHLTRQITAS